MVEGNATVEQTSKVTEATKTVKRRGPRVNKFSATKGANVNLSPEQLAAIAAIVGKSAAPHHEKTVTKTVKQHIVVGDEKVGAMVTKLMASETPAVIAGSIVKLIAMRWEKESGWTKTMVVAKSGTVALACSPLSLGEGVWRFGKKVLQAAIEEASAVKDDVVNTFEESKVRSILMNAPDLSTAICISLRSMSDEKRNDVLSSLPRGMHIAIADAYVASRQQVIKTAEGVQAPAEDKVVEIDSTTTVEETA